MAGRIRGVFFDLGDTLLNFGHVDVPSLFESGAHLAYTYLRSLGKALPPFAAYHRSQLWAVRWGYFKSRVTGREFDARALIARLGRKMGHQLTDHQIDELAWLWYEPLSRCAAVEPGLRATLEHLSRGRTLGLISNTFIPASALDRHLAQAGLVDLLPVRVYSCDVRFRKPHAAIFQVALGRANLPAQETLFVGDSPVADITGARRVGMITVLKDSTGRYATSRVHPDRTISRLSELPALVAGYEGTERAGSAALGALRGDRMVHSAPRPEEWDRPMDRVLVALAGAVAGAAVGFLAGRARVCSVAGCSARTNLIVSVVGWAVFGAAVGYYLATR